MASAGCVFLKYSAPWHERGTEHEIKLVYRPYVAETEQTADESDIGIRAFERKRAARDGRGFVYKVVSVYLRMSHYPAEHLAHAHIFLVGHRQSENPDGYISGTLFSAMCCRRTEQRIFFSLFSLLSKHIVSAFYTILYNIIIPKSILFLKFNIFNVCFFFFLHIPS